MASSKKYNRRKHTTKSGSNKRRSSCSGGKSSRRRRGDKKKNGTHRWHQKGCQSGGGSMTGGWPWGPSDVQHSGGGGGVGGVSPVPQSINGNHYSLNTTTLAPPQSSNHLVEKGMFGGGAGTRRRGRGRRHRKYIGEQHGGMAEYLPETANTSLRGITEIPARLQHAFGGNEHEVMCKNCSKSLHH
jgi:hypothetical protein